MADATFTQIKARFDCALDRFLSHTAGPRRTHHRVFDQMAELGWDTCIFGGALRSILTNGPDASMRDIDIVVSGVETDQIAQTFGCYVQGRTKFGGFKLCIDGTSFDIWPLHQTWAFQNRHLPAPSFDELPKSTFLTTDAIVVHLPPRGGQRRVIEHRFFESIANRVLDVNLPENPYPSLAMIRTLVTSRQLGFNLGPPLVECLRAWSTSMKVSDILRAQHDHYRTAVLSKAEIRKELNRIRAQHGRDGLTRIHAEMKTH